MLGFFRRYQKIFFIIITVMVLISFSFFGTSQSLIPGQMKQKKGEYLFSVQKRKIYSNYFDQMVHFLEVEPSYCADPFKIVDLNPLNDGVISQDFLAPQLLAQVVGSQFSSAFFETHQKEKKFSLFESDKGFSMVSTWESFAPQVKHAFDSFCALDEGSSFAELLEAKSILALAHQRMNGEMVKSIINYLAMQSGKEISLPNDLSLFGYHTWSDWFGKNSVQQIAKVIICGAEAAKKKGIKVAKQEVAQELFTRSSLCLKALKERGNFDLNEQQFFQFLISRSGVDQENLFRIWEDILYFRRGIDQELSSVIVDAHALESFSRIANESITVKGKGMSQALQFKNEKDWMEWEIYVDAVGVKEDILSLPFTQKELSLIAKTTPELCGKRYIFQVRKVEKDQLRAKVALQELRRWQKDHDIIAYYGKDKEKEMDDFSYGEIIDMHPEWIEDALAKKEPHTIHWFSSLGEKSFCLEGVNPTSFAKLLENKENISCYTEDNKHYYRIEAIEEKELECLSYQEAKQEKILEKLYESGRYLNLQIRVKDALSNYLVQSGISLPQENKEQFLASHRFVKQLQIEELACFDSSFLPSQFFETIERSHPDFAKIKMLRNEKKGCILQNRGFVMLEKQEELTDSSASFTKLKLLHKLTTLDLRKKIVKQIVEGMEI